MPIPPALATVAGAQDGIVSRRDCLRAGMSRHAIAHQLETRRWRLVHEGVYATVTGTLDFRQRVWAALLFCGPGAVAAGGTALSVYDDRRPHRGPLVVAVPHKRRVHAPAGISVVRRKELSFVESPGVPPHQPPDVAVLDHAAVLSDATSVVALVCEAARSRWVSPTSLGLRLDAMSRHRWRSVIADLVAETGVGVESPLESRDLRNDRAHGLPVGRRQVSVRVGSSRRRRDVRLTLPNGAVLTKELDGRLGHESGRFRDRRLDNAAALGGETALRFGWEDLVGTPCAVAAVETHVLWQLGWTGRPRVCGRACRIFAELDVLAAAYPLVRLR